MARLPLVVPRLQRHVPMHGLVADPILMLEMQGTCCAREGSWALTPKGSLLLRITVLLPLGL